MKFIYKENYKKKKLVIKIEITKEFASERVEANLEQNWRIEEFYWIKKTKTKLLFGGTRCHVYRPNKGNEIPKVQSYIAVGPAGKNSQRYRYHYHFRKPKSYRNGTLFDTSLWRYVARPLRPPDILYLCPKVERLSPIAKKYRETIVKNPENPSF